MNGSNEVEDLICLSSSDEDEPHKKKRRITPKKLECPIEPPKVNSNGKFIEENKNGADIICLDSDEEETDIEDNSASYHQNGINLSEKTKNLTTNGVQDEAPMTECNNSAIIENRNNLSNGVQISSENEFADSEVFPDEFNFLEDIEDLPEEPKLFLTTCKEQLNGKDSSTLIFKRFPTLIKMFKELAHEYSNSEYLKNFLRKQITIAKESENNCIVSFRDVFEHLKVSLQSEGVELTKKQRKHARKLEKFMQIIVDKLKEFSEAEIDFDADENDSPYIKEDIYSRRLAKIHKKYCKILERNPYAGRLTHEKLAFVSSNYNEINLAINKKYKNNKFPNYWELSNFIEATAKEKNLSLSANQLKAESKHCFKKLGELLQSRRKKELYESHCSHITNMNDPAEKDRDLENKLRISTKEGLVKIEQVYEEYVKKQELGIKSEEVNCDTTEDEDEEEDEENEDD